LLGSITDFQPKFWHSIIFHWFVCHLLNELAKIYLLSLVYKGVCISIFQVTDQDRITELDGKTGKNEIVKMMVPGNLFNQYHPGMSQDNKGLVIPTRKSAHNFTSKQNTQNLMKIHGLRKGDTSANVYAAAQYCVDDDDSMWRTMHDIYGNCTKLVLSDKYMGALHQFGYQAIPRNRGTTPFLAILCTARAIQTFNLAAPFGTVVFHIDGTKSRVPWGALVKQDDICQLWIGSISATFLQLSHTNADPNSAL
jgi:hypothetical protein